MGNIHACVKRALTDFGSEESFGQACKRFEEHYGWKVERSYVRRYVDSRLLELATSFKNQEPPKKKGRKSKHRLLLLPFSYPYCLLVMTVDYSLSI